MGARSAACEPARRTRRLDHRFALTFSTGLHDLQRGQVNLFRAIAAKCVRHVVHTQVAVGQSNNRSRTVWSGRRGRCVAVQGALTVGAYCRGGAVGIEGELPAPSVDGDEVVEGAEQAAVGDGGVAAVGPSAQVVDVTGDGGLVAAGEAAVVVAAGDSPAEVGGDVGGGAHVQRQADRGGGPGELAAKLRGQSARAGQQPQRVVDGQAGGGPAGPAYRLVAAVGRVCVR